MPVPHSARSRRHHGDAGFSLVELMVVVLVIAVLLAIAIPMFLGARAQAQDRTAQANLVTAAKAESTLAASDSAFTAVIAALEAEEPALDWSGASDSSVHVVVGDVIAGDSRQVLLYTQSGSGTWFGIKIVSADGPGITAGRYTCEGTAESQVDALVDCTGNAW